MMVRDLIVVERELGFHYEMTRGGAEHYQQICPRCRRALFGLAQGRAVERHRPIALAPRAESWRRLPVDELDDHRAVRPAPVGDDGRAAVDQRRAGPARQDPLLLLRPAVRHPAQGAGQRGHRLRAVGGVPVQPRHALPEGREALPAGLASRSAARPRSAAIRQRRRASARCRTTQAIAQVAAEIERIQTDARQRADRRARRREPDDREDLPARQVRARLPEDAVHRLQRPALHGQRRRGEQEGVRHRPHDQSRGPTWSAPR